MHSTASQVGGSTEGWELVCVSGDGWGRERIPKYRDLLYELRRGLQGRPPRLKVRETVSLLHGSQLLEKPSLPETASREEKEKEGRRIPGKQVLLTCQQPPSTRRACPAPPCPLCTD